MGSKITMAHGSGGRATSELIDQIFAAEFHNEILDRMEDSAVVDVPGGSIAMTTDSFVVTPVFFPGGDIGRLAVCGTVNDLAMSGAIPKYLTCGYIIEEGADIEDIRRIAHSMAETAAEAGVTIVAGDTKVIDGNGGVCINTAGVGIMPANAPVIRAGNCAEGDVIIVSGALGDHHAAILGARMEILNDIKSDVAPLTQMSARIIEAGIEVHAMRDITRGGLGTILNEFAKSSGKCMEIFENKLPVHDSVRGFCSLLGLDPVYMGNEGKLVITVPEKDAEKTVDCIKSCNYGSEAAIIGNVTTSQPGSVIMHTPVGGSRVITELIGEGLPRIC